MNLHELVSQLIVDTKGSASSSLLDVTRDSSLWAFLPEMILCVTIVLLLFARLLKLDRAVGSFLIVLIGGGVALYFAAPWQYLSGQDASVTRMEIFTGMLVYDKFSIFMRAVLLLFAMLFALLTRISGIPDREDGPDIYTLVLGSTLGMCLMVSANHLLIIFLAVEMASVPSYVLAGMLKGRRVGSEAALKYSVYGAGAAGVMLYGISLVAGLANTAHLPTMAIQLSRMLPDMALEQQLVLATGGLLIMVGLAFKLSAVPFHFWCPDVFEGASAEVNAFLSVASKAAALGLLVRVAIGFGAIPPQGVAPGSVTAAGGTNPTRVVAREELSESRPAESRPAESRPADRSASFGARPGDAPVAGILVSRLQDAASRDESGGGERHADPVQHGDEHAAGAPSDHDQAAHDRPMDRAAGMTNLAPLRGYLAKLIALLAAITCTFGNLAAYGQTNIKRLLAYSTIAHAGYMMMAVPPMLELAGVDPVGAQNAVSSLAVYVAVYLFMNLGAFAVVAFLRNAMRSEEIADYAGLIRRCPVLVVCFSLMLFSLIGMPPLAGFIGKFAVFAALAGGYQTTSALGSPATYLLALLLIGGINTAISLFYYLRVVKVMTIDPEPEDRPIAFRDASIQGAYVWLVTLPTVLLIVKWDWLNTWALEAAKWLLA